MDSSPHVNNEVNLQNDSMKVESSNDNERKDRVIVAGTARAQDDEKSKDAQGMANVKLIKTYFEEVAKQRSEHIEQNVQILIGRDIIPCNIKTLQKHCGYFRDKDFSEPIRISKKEIKSSTFYQIYEWMQDNAKINIDNEFLLTLYHGARYLQVDGVVEYCLQRFRDSSVFKEKLAFETYFEAAKYGSETAEIREIMLSRICRYFLPLVSRIEYLILPESEIIKLLSFNTIAVNSEIDIFFAAFRWVRYSWPLRKRSVVNVFNMVRFEQLPVWFLSSLHNSGSCEFFGPILNRFDPRKLAQDTFVPAIYKQWLRAEMPPTVVEDNGFGKNMNSRRYLVDRAALYHHAGGLLQTLLTPYRMYLNYLDLIRNIGDDYWRSFKLI